MAASGVESGRCRAEQMDRFMQYAAQHTHAAAQIQHLRIQPALYQRQLVRRFLMQAELEVCSHGRAGEVPDIGRAGEDGDIKKN